MAGNRKLIQVRILVYRSEERHSRRTASYRTSAISSLADSRRLNALSIDSCLVLYIHRKYLVI